MLTLRYVLGGVLALAAVVIAFGNATTISINRRYRRDGIDKHVSCIHMMSILAGGFAWVWWPGTFGRWFLLIPVLDWANWVLVGSILASLFGHEESTE